MINVKSPLQVEAMRKAGALLYEIIERLKEAIQPGTTTAALDAYAEQLIRKAGAIPSFLGYQGYPATLCTSIDDQVVHGIPNDEPLRLGCILSVDSGLVLEGWQADSAFTVGIGEISPEARRLIDVTEVCFWKGAAQAKAGNRIGDIGYAVQQWAEKHGYQPVRALCGHGIGRNMHEDPEVPNYGTAGHGARMRAGMTIAVEPMISAGTWEVELAEDDWTVSTRDKSLCSHYEHTMLITEDGPPEILTLPGFVWKEEEA